MQLSPENHEFFCESEEMVNDILTKAREELIAKHEAEFAEEL